MNPDFGIINEKQEEGFTVVTVDTNKATYLGMEWHTLGDFGKRKLENLLVLGRSTERLKIQYV